MKKKKVKKTVKRKPAKKVVKKKKSIKKVKKPVKKVKKPMKKTIKKVVAKIRTKLQDEKYWIARKLDDKVRDWGTDATDWLSEYWGSQSHPHRALIIEALHEIEFDSVLEVGCNVGANLNQIKTHFPEVKLTGIDVNADAIKFASSLIGGTFEVASINKIPFGKDSFSCILSDAVLMYIEPKKIKKAIKEICRVTKDTVILVEWFDNSELGKIKDYHWARNYPKLLEKEGFEIIVKHKITEQEWPNPQWVEHGYLFVAKRVNAVSKRT